MSEAAVIERLDTIEALLRRLQREIERTATPVMVLTAQEVCATLHISRSGLSKHDARQTFSDARPPEQRRQGRPRMYFADEIGIYPKVGRAGVKRFRKEVGRL